MAAAYSQWLYVGLRGDCATAQYATRAALCAKRIRAPPEIPRNLTRIHKKLETTAPLRLY